MDIRIARATAQDGGKIALIERDIFSDAWSERDVVDETCREVPMCYCAYDGDELCAYVIGRRIDGEGEIYRVATLPSYRGRGIAKNLITRLTRDEGELGLRDLYLEVRESNVPARRLYTGCGFKEISKRRNYYKNPSEDAVIMHLALVGEQK